MKINKKILGLGAAFLTSALLSVTASAGGGGDCNVRTESAFGSVFYIPSGGTGSYNVLGWGNGTASTVGQYDGMLESVAEQCILIAAATTTNSGSGAAVEDSVNAALSRYSNIINSNPTVCTSGHSQGGGGSFNSANRLNADCVIAVQPDTVFTTSIFRPVSSSTDVVCIFSFGDTLAPALPSNSLNCRLNSTRYSEEIVSGTHFAPYSGTGGDVGAEMRDYAQRWLVD